MSEDLGAGKDLGMGKDLVSGRATGVGISRPEGKANGKDQ